MPTMRASCPSRYSHSVVSSVLTIRRAVACRFRAICSLHSQPLYCNRAEVVHGFALDDGAGHPQVLFMVGVDILGIIGFNKIVALFRQHNIGGGQNSVEFLVADDPTLFALKTVQAAGKVRR